jgi:hypothetical protein
MNPRNSDLYAKMEGGLGHRGSGIPSFRMKGNSQALVAYVCNSSYLGGSNWEDSV